MLGEAWKGYFLISTWDAKWKPNFDWALEET